MGSKPGFFSVILSPQKLGIPNDFVSQSGGSLATGTIFLRDQYMNSWTVEISTDGDEWYLDGGWLQFFRGSCLQINDLVTFENKCGNLFDVELYECNGCMKKGLGRPEMLRDKNAEPMDYESEKEDREGLENEEKLLGDEDDFDHAVDLEKRTRNEAPEQGSGRIKKEAVNIEVSASQVLRGKRKIDVRRRSDGDDGIEVLSEKMVSSGSRMKMEPKLVSCSGSKVVCDSGNRVKENVEGNRVHPGRRVRPGKKPSHVSASTVGSTELVDFVMSEHEPTSEDDADDDNGDDNDEYNADEEEKQVDTRYKAKSSNVSNRNSSGANSSGIGTTCSKPGRKSIGYWYGDEIFESRCVRRPDNPYFVSRSRSAVTNELYIPKGVIKDHRLVIPEKFHLVDKLGKKYEAFTNPPDRQLLFIRGWKNLCNANQIKKNEVLLCECVCEKQEDGSNKLLHIRISPL